MSDAACPSEADAAAAAALAPLRVRGGVQARFHAARGGTHITDLAESGGYRLRFPTTHAPHLEATQINTGGGVAGGDRVDFAFVADSGTDVVVATQAAERIYRTNGPESRIGMRLTLAAGARLDWLPQETILYSGARLQRRFEVELAPDAQLLMVEAITFGRIASGEAMASGELDDGWRVRRDGRLIFADRTRLDGHIGELLARPALAGGDRAMAIMLFVAPDATDRLDAVRAVLADARSHCGASAWNGMLTVRFQGADGGSVRRDVINVVQMLSGRPLPRVWQT